MIVTYYNSSWGKPEFEEEPGSLRSTTRKGGGPHRNYLNKRLNWDTGLVSIEDARTWTTSNMNPGWTKHNETQTKNNFGVWEAPAFQDRKTEAIFEPTQLIQPSNWWGQSADEAGGNRGESEKEKQKPTSRYCHEAPERYNHINDIPKNHAAWTAVWSMAPSLAAIWSFWRVKSNEKFQSFLSLRVYFRRKCMYQLLI